MHSYFFLGNFNFGKFILGIFKGTSLSNTDYGNFDSWNKKGVTQVTVQGNLMANGFQVAGKMKVVNTDTEEVITTFDSGYKGTYELDIHPNELPNEFTIEMVDSVDVAIAKRNDKIIQKIEIIIKPGIEIYFPKFIDNFLNIKYADDANNHTQQYIELCKDFSTEIIKTSYGAQEQNTFLAKTIDFFKENEVVNVERFKEELFEEDKHKREFDNFKKDFEGEQNLVIRNQFDVAEAVVTKEKRKIKTDIKLDTNIQIKLDIDSPDASSEYLERGYDDEKKMHYYKVFFNAES